MCHFSWVFLDFLNVFHLLWTNSSHFLCLYFCSNLQTFQNNNSYVMLIRGGNSNDYNCQIKDNQQMPTQESRCYILLYINFKATITEILVRWSILWAYAQMWCSWILLKMGSIFWITTPLTCQKHLSGCMVKVWLDDSVGKVSASMKFWIKSLESIQWKETDNFHELLSDLWHVLCV